MKTKNGLKSNAKTVSIEVLNARLADGIDLGAAHQAGALEHQRRRISSRCMR